VDFLLARVDTLSEIIDKKTVYELFSYHGSILSVNMELKNQLTQRLTDWHVHDCVGDIFTALVYLFNKTPFLRVYSLFLTNFSHALKLLDDLSQNTKWNAFLKSVQSQGLGLQAYLLCPVQRIPRYKLLLQDMLKNTPVDHRDYEELKKGVEMVGQGRKYSHSLWFRQ
jgi:hypothetical protein